MSRRSTPDMLPTITWEPAILALQRGMLKGDGTGGVIVTPKYRLTMRETCIHLKRQDRNNKIEETPDETYLRITTEFMNRWTPTLSNADRETLTPFIWALLKGETEGLLK